LKKSIYHKILRDAAGRSNYQPSIRFFEAAWNSLAGPQLAQRSCPTNWANGILEITVQDAWFEAVSNLQGELLDRIRFHIPWEIRDLTLVRSLAKRPPAGKPRQVQHRRESPTLGDWQEGNGEALDEDLRDTLARIRNTKG
jgi:hypothetical protein